MKNKTGILTGVLGLALLAAFFATPAQAQALSYGSQVKAGDSDFIQTVIAPPGGALFHVAFGTPTDFTDDGYYLHMVGSGTSVATHDVRLVAFGGKAAGSLLTDSDVQERAAAGQSTTASVLTADVNNNGRYDVGDCVWIRSNADGNGHLAAPANTAGSVGDADDVFTIRVTACKDKAAGTLVLSGDQDLQAYESSGTTVQSVIHTSTSSSKLGYFDADLNSAFTLGDNLYLSPITAITNTAAVVPQNSIRLVGGAGAFGSFVAFGDADFRPTLTTTGLPGTAAIYRINFGDQANFQDDTFYVDLTSAGSTVSTYDLRVSPFGSMAAGTLVQDSDVSERNTGIQITTFAYKFADLNSNNRYDSGDCAYVVANPPTPGLRLPAGTGTSADQFSVRLTACLGKGAGTLVLGGDQDFNSYGTTAAVITGGAIAYYDADQTSTVTPGDRVYLTGAALAGLNLVPLYSVRLVGDAGQFGGQVKFGDNDFVPILTGPQVTNVVRVTFGDPTSVLDDGVYLKWSTGTTAATYDIRLVPYGGKAAGTLVADTDSQERNQGAGAGGKVVYVDLNSNGRYDGGDYVYYVVSAQTCSTNNAACAVVASTTTTSWSVRLTPAGSMGAGTFVKQGEADLVNYGANAALITPTNTAFFDADLSTGFTPGDRMYLAPQTVSAGNLVPLNSVRLAGEAFTPPPVTTSPTGTSPTGTSPTGTSPTGTSPTGTSPTGTSPTGTSPTSPTTSPAGQPGFEAVFVLGAVAALVIALRRKN